MRAVNLKQTTMTQGQTITTRYGSIRVVNNANKLSVMIPQGMTGKRLNAVKRTLKRKS